MWAALIQEPRSPDRPAWQRCLAPIVSAFLRSMRGWKRVYRAKRLGALQHSITSIDPVATGAVPGIDCIGRRFLTIGPTLAAALIASDGGTADLYRDLDKFFVTVMTPIEPRRMLCVWSSAGVVR